MAKSTAERLAEHKFRAEGLDTPEVSAPPIIIVSDGTPEGTKLMLNGELVAFKRMDIYCSKGDEYASCSMSVTMEESGQDGMSVEKTITLRKEKDLD